MEEAIKNQRRKSRHRRALVNDIKRELDSIKGKQNIALDNVDLWRGNSGFKPKFLTHETWMLSRETKAQCTGARSIWFSEATQSLLSTMDHVSHWSHGVDTTCVLCKNAQETRNHLFFECSFSSQIWKHLIKGILQSSYTTDWVAVEGLIIDSSMKKKKLFYLRYAFQATMYTLWRERNNCRHGDQALPLHVLIKLIDKGIRNKLSLVQSKRLKGLEGILQYWFGTRL